MLNRYGSRATVARTRAGPSSASPPAMLRSGSVAFECATGSGVPAMGRSPQELELLAFAINESKMFEAMASQHNIGDAVSRE